MSYRNDHDAALNRVAALESELARLRGERTEKPEKEVSLKPETGGEHRLGKVIAVGVGAALCVVGMVARATRTEARPPVDQEGLGDVPVLNTPIVPMDESTCMNEIDARAATDARAADPRNSVKTPVVSLLRSPIACRLSSKGASGELENVTSLITVYYEGDPVAMDSYQSAEQLWREYHRARARAI